MLAVRCAFFYLSYFSDSFVPMVNSQVEEFAYLVSSWRWIVKKDLFSTNLLRQFNFFGRNGCHQTHNSQRSFNGKNIITSSNLLHTSIARGNDDSYMNNIKTGYGRDQQRIQFYAIVSNNRSCNMHHAPCTHTVKSF